MDFTGQVAVVTGGAQGIGGATADILRKGGARIAIWDQEDELAREKAARLGGDSLAVPVDISDWDNVTAARDKTLEEAGRIDILVNSAGIAGMTTTL